MFPPPSRMAFGENEGLTFVRKSVYSPIACLRTITSEPFGLTRSECSQQMCSSQGMPSGDTAGLQASAVDKIAASKISSWNDANSPSPLTWRRT